MAWWEQRYAALKGQNSSPQPAVSGGSTNVYPPVKTQNGQKPWWYDRYTQGQQSGLFDNLRRQQQEIQAPPPKPTAQVETVKADKSWKDKIFDTLDRAKKDIQIGTDFAVGGLRNTTGMIASWLAQEGEKNQPYYDEMAKKHPEIYGTDKFKQERADQLKSIKSFAQAAKEMGGEKFQEGKQKQQQLGEAKGFQWLADQVLQATPGFLSSFGIAAATSVVTKNPVAGVALGFSGQYVQTAGQAYQDAKDFGVSDKKAEDVANVAGIASGILNVIPLGRFLERSPAGEEIKKSILKEVVKSTIKQGSLQASTASLDQILQNAIKTTYNEKQQLFEGVPEAAITSFTLGGITGGADELGIVRKGNKTAETIQKANETIKEAVNTPKEKRTPLQQDIVDTFYTKELTPQQVSQMVLEKDLAGTPLGQTLLKRAAEAAQEKKNVKVVGDENSNEIKVQTVDKSVFEVDPKSLESGALKNVINEKIAGAKAYDSEFQGKVDSVGKDLGYEVLHGPVKGEERTLEKTIREYQGNTNELRDLNRATILIDKPSQFNDVVSGIKNQFGDAQVERVKDGFSNEGYKSAIVNVKTPSGGIAEIQVTFPEYQRAKEELGGHKLYEAIRSAPDPTVQEIMALQEQMNKLYADAESARVARVGVDKELNSSSDTSRALNNTSAGGNTVPSGAEAVTRLPSDSNLTGTPSKSKKRGNLEAKSATLESSIKSPPSNDTVSQKTKQHKPQETAQTEAKPQTPVGEGKTNESRLFERVKETLGQEYETAKREYNKLNLENDAKKAVDFLNENPDAAIRVAKGIEEPPAGQTANAIGVAAALKAQAEGKTKLAADLWTSVSLRSTRLGQEIVSLRGNMNDDSPQNYIKQVISQRMNKLGSNIMDEVKAIAGAPSTAKQRAIEKIDRQAAKVKEVLTREQTRIKLAQDIIEQLRCK